MAFQSDQPFDDLPMLPPATELETKPVLKACIEARAALAELRGAGGLIPNQSVLINSIPLLEAKSSSEIENIVTTTDALFKLAGNPDASTDPATKETLRYRTALRAGFEGLADHPISTRLAVEVCSMIKGVDMDIRRVPGTALMSDRLGEII